MGFARKAMNPIFMNNDIQDGVEALGVQVARHPCEGVFVPQLATAHADLKTGAMVTEQI